VVGINTKLRRDINSPGFSACLLLIQLVWVAVECRPNVVLPQPE